ncbi:Ig-like domain-containing protein [Aeromicrobium sp. CTD01-1L150]|uniref:Ig-like domain-containing protein n=1 Tax=Aeromicrobium sp. CTD01-1L150 TaxID=3341830 RepID=UPI0035C234BE
MAQPSPAHAVNEETFTDPAGTDWTVPAGVSRLEFEVVGASGGGGGFWDGGQVTWNGLGGFGSRVTGAVDVQPGQLLRFHGSTMGGNPVPTPPSGGNGGIGFRHGGDGGHRGGWPGTGARAGGGGGGASALLGPVGSSDDFSVLAVAGGGGGGGGWGRLDAWHGGNGGEYGPDRGAYDGGRGQGVAAGSGGERSGGGPTGDGGSAGSGASGSGAGGGGGGGGGVNAEGSSGGGGAGGSGGVGGGSGGGGAAGDRMVHPVVEDHTFGVDSGERRDGFVTIRYVFDTTTTVSVEPEAPHAGQAVTLNAQVENQNDAGDVPRGSVGFWAMDSDGELVQNLGAEFASGSSGSGRAVATAHDVELPEGTASIRAAYAPATAAHPAMGASHGTTDVTVQEVQTSTTMTIDPERSVYGQSLSIDVDVAPLEAPPGIGPVTGEVQLLLDSQPVGTVGLRDGSAEFTVEASSVGGSTFEARYLGASGFQESSDRREHATDRADTSVSLWVDPESVAVGQPVDVRAVVAARAPGQGVVEGRVTLWLDGEETDTSELSGGETTFEVRPEAVDEHEVRITYKGSDHFTESESDTLNFEAGPVASTVELAIDPVVAVVGQSVSLEAAVGTEGAGEAPTDGAIQFLLDDEPLGQAVTVEGGRAMLQTDRLPVGTSPVTAEYSGNAAGTRSGASSAATDVQVSRAEIDVEASSTPSPSSTYGEPVELSAVVTLRQPAVTDLTGEIDFLDPDDTVIVSADLGPVTDDGTAGAAGHLRRAEAVASVDDLPVGEHEIRAVHRDTAAIVGSESVPFDLQVHRGQSQVNLSASSAQSFQGEEVTVTASVGPRSPSVRQPTGAVQFLIDGRERGEPVGLAGSGAELTVSDLPAGEALIEARYLGDDGYEPSEADLDHLVVEPAASGGGGGSGASTPDPTGSDISPEGTGWLPGAGSAMSWMAAVIAVLLLVVGGLMATGTLRLPSRARSQRESASGRSGRRPLRTGVKALLITALIASGSSAAVPEPAAHAQQQTTAAQQHTVTVSGRTEGALNETPVSRNWVVPAGVRSITYEVVGGSGGGFRRASGGLASIANEGRGGYGARITGQYSVTPGQQFAITAGNQGVSDVARLGGSGWVDGGRGGEAGSTTNDSTRGGGGGAVSRLSGPGLLALAGGGGGAGGRSSTLSHGGNGGDAGRLAGDGQRGGSGSEHGGGGGGMGADPALSDQPGSEAAPLEGGGGAGSGGGGGGGGGGAFNSGSGSPYPAANGLGGAGGGGGGAGDSYANSRQLQNTPFIQTDTGDERGDPRPGFIRITYTVSYPTETTISLDTDDLSAATPTTVRATVSNRDSGPPPPGVVTLWAVDADGDDLQELGRRPLSAGPASTGVALAVQRSVRLPAGTAAIRAEYDPDPGSWFSGSSASLAPE